MSFNPISLRGDSSLVPLAAAAGTALAVGIPSWLLVKRIVRAWAMRKFTVVPDLAKAGTRRAGKLYPGTAVVCGGRCATHAPAHCARFSKARRSIGGLLTARVCADHFERVVVVEPEAWTFTDEARDPPRDIVRDVEKDSTKYRTVQSSRSRVYQYGSIHGACTRASLSVPPHC